MSISSDVQVLMKSTRMNPWATHNEDPSSNAREQYQTWFWERRVEASCKSFLENAIDVSFLEEPMAGSNWQRKACDSFC